MGNDGGSIPRRREVVKQKKREEKKENYEMAKAKASLCSLSKDTLREPMVVCKLGLLYNKEEVIKRLLEKNMPNAFRHIRKLKDIKDIKAQLKKNTDNSITIVCPISQVEFNGFHRFLTIWNCGCVISEDAAKELKLCDKCLNCGISIDKKTDIISLNQSHEEQEAYLSVVDQEIKQDQDKQQLKKKKSKKRTERKEDDEEEKDDKKRQKVDDGQIIKNKLRESEAYKSLFQAQYEENKDTDFLCRNVHRGLR